MIEGITPILRHTTACDYHRVILPLKYLGFDIENQKPLKDANLLFFNRIPNCEMDEIKGKPYILDIDDYWYLPKDHYLYGRLRPDYSDLQIELIKNARIILTTNSYLADEIAYLNKKVEIVPNGLPFGSDQFQPQEHLREGEVKFIYSCGPSHTKDLELVKDVFNNSPVKLTLGGYDPTNYEFIKMGKMFRNIDIIKVKQFDSYMNVYDGFDVSIAPLVKNEFNVLKSNLKLLEAGCKGLAVIASACEPYLTKSEFKYVDYAKNTYDWVQLIKRYSTSPDYVREKGFFLYQFVKENYHLDKFNEIRTQIFTDVLSKG